MKTTNSEASSQGGIRTFKIVASKAGTVIFDDRVEAETPREAREIMKKALGLESLSGVVHAITEIPMELIREVVAAQMAELVLASQSDQPIDISALVNATVATILQSRLEDINRRLEAIEKSHELPSSPVASASVAEEPANVSTEAAPEPNPAITGPDWDAIRQHYDQTRSVKQTAALFNVSVNTLKARIRREGWGK